MVSTDTNCQQGQCMRDTRWQARRTSCKTEPLESTASGYESQARHGEANHNLPSSPLGSQLNLVTSRTMPMARQIKWPKCPLSVGKDSVTLLRAEEHIL